MAARAFFVTYIDQDGNRIEESFRRDQVAAVKRKKKLIAEGAHRVKVRDRLLNGSQVRHMLTKRDQCRRLQR